MSESNMNANIQVDEIQKQITDEVIKELQQTGATIIPSVYNGGKKLAETVEKFAKLESDFKKHYESESKRITERYAPEVAKKKISDLNVDYMVESSYLRDSLDDILTKEIKYRKEAIKNNTSSTEYKSTRSEAIQILLSLGNKLDEQSTMELIKPIVEAKDLTYLKILSNTQNNKTRYIYNMAIEEAERYHNTKDLEKAIQDAKVYMNNPKGGRSLALEQHIYKSDSKAYERIRNIK